MLFVVLDAGFVWLVLLVVLVLTDPFITTRVPLDRVVFVVVVVELILPPPD